MHMIDDVLRAMYQAMALEDAARFPALMDLLRQEKTVTVLQAPDVREFAIAAACSLSQPIEQLIVLDILARKAGDRHRILRIALHIIEAIHDEFKQASALSAIRYPLAGEGDLWSEAWDIVSRMSDPRLRSEAQALLREARKTERRKRSILFQPGSAPVVLFPEQRFFLEAMELGIIIAFKQIDRFERAIKQRAQPLPDLVCDNLSLPTLLADVEAARQFAEDAEEWLPPEGMEDIHILYLNTLDDLIDVAGLLVMAYQDPDFESQYLNAAVRKTMEAKQRLTELRQHSSQYAVDPSN